MRRVLSKQQSVSNETEIDEFFGTLLLEEHKILCEKKKKQRKKKLYDSIKIRLNDRSPRNDGSTNINLRKLPSI